MNITRFIAIALITLLPVYGSADVLLIEDVQRVQAMNLPGNGLTREAVAERWGEPLQRHPAVGDPPITRWRYQDFSVYFEYNLVLTSTPHHRATADRE